MIARSVPAPVNHHRGSYTSPALAAASYPFVDLPLGNTLRCKLFPSSKFTIHLFPKEAGHSIIKLTTDKATNKQFITVQTSGGNTFYIIIDYDKPTDEDGEQYQTYFLNMVDEADLLTAMQAAGGELPECSCADKCAVGVINTDCTVCAVNMSECQGKAPEPAPVVEPEPDPEPEQPKATGNGGMLLLALAVVVIGGGAGWYFKIYRPKKQRAAESEADYGGEYDGAEDYDETDPEDDGPPWDEDGEE